LPKKANPGRKITDCIRKEAGKDELPKV
jgi:hypothetical protein